MEWIKASERLPENKKEDRPLKVDGVYYLGWYSGGNKKWFTDSNNEFASSEVEWLSEDTQADNQDELWNQFGNSMLYHLHKLNSHEIRMFIQVQEKQFTITRK